LKLDTFLTTFGNWTLRVRPGKGKRIILLLHGWTGDEDSMSIFSRNFPDEYWIISPRAPFSAIPSGYSWRSQAPKGSWPTIDLFRPSVDGLIELMDQWSSANDLDKSSFDVAGFSQGGALSLTLGAIYPNLVGKMGILSGFAPDGTNEVLSPGKLSGKNIFLAHGTQDEIVPISMALRTIQILEGAGALVSYCESPSGHKLSADCMKALVRYLSN
jgi:phospholipase/carboxylesterase